MITGTISDPAGFKTLENFSRTPGFNRWLYDKIKGFAKGQILEIGSGIGNISDYLLQDQKTVSLSDLRPEYCQLLEKKFGQDSHLQAVYELDLSEPDFELKYSNLLGRFDTVFALNVVEHIEKDSIAVQNAKALLRMNGKLVVLVPAGERLFNLLDRELGHFKRYSKSGLITLMESAGLSVVCCRYFNAAAILGWWVSGNVLREKVIPSSKLNLYNHLVPVFRIIDWFITPFAGLSLITAATKTNK